MIKKQDSEINQKSCFLITLYYFDDFFLFVFLLVFEIKSSGTKAGTDECEGKCKKKVVDKISLACHRFDL